MTTLSEKELLKAIDRGNIPKHVAIIMDGNGRWAKARRLPRINGHKAGVKSVKNVVSGCRELGVGVLTLYAFSTENWSRPAKEIRMLMQLLYRYLKSEVNTLKKNNIELRAIGDLAMLPANVQRELRRVHTLTAGKGKMILNLALNYGARKEILDAVRKLSAVSGPKSLDEETLSNCLYTKDLPDPDLLIRTSGEHRISNFLLWQIAYTELYFTDVLWPEFAKGDLYEAILDFQNRERRYGGI